ncbi:MAG: hypothetical protein QME05_01260 [Candidatus Margulisbacteria bacterium]|nr:hypothetical protein [Candidatus Margulisiibacteriota bacterium]
MKKYFTVIFVLIIVFFMAASALASDQETANFKATIDQLQMALVFGDMDYIHAHLSLNSILQAKIKKFSSLVQKQGGFWKRTAAKIVGAGESLAAKGAAVVIEKEYGKTSRSLRKFYKNSLNLSSYKVKGDKATASGSFLGSPALLSAVKIKGKWVVVGVESPLIDKEVKRILKLK